MALLKKSEVLLMQEDVLVHGFKRVGLPYFQEDDLGDARRLFTPSVGEAVLRFRNANERAYVANVRKETMLRLLEPSSRRIADFARTQVDNIFANREENFMRFFRYLAFILDLAVFAHRYRKVHLMNPVFVECEAMFDAFLSTEEGLPFWRNFMALCDTVLRNSPEAGRPIRHFRNPALYWNPRDPTFNPDDPAAYWVVPNLRLHPDHPILKPDRHAFMSKFWKEVKSSVDRRAENADEGDEYLNLGVESLNLSGESSKLVVQRLDAESSNLVVDESYFGADSSNLVVQRSGADSSNRGVQISCLGADSSNLVVKRYDFGAENSNLVVDSTNLGAESSNLVENPNLSAENLNVGAVRNAGREDENSNRSAESSRTGTENLNVGDENSNSKNENSQHVAQENVDTGALNPDPHPFDVLIAAMQWDIHDIVFNTDPQDPALD